MPLDALLLQLSYALLVVAVLAPRMSLAAHARRAGGAGRACPGPAVDRRPRLRDLDGALLLVACLVLIGRSLYESRKVAFTADEDRMLGSLVAGLSQSGRGT